LQKCILLSDLVYLSSVKDAAAGEDHGHARHGNDIGGGGGKNVGVGVKGEKERQRSQRDEFVLVY
jgi:hypothetical protein